MQLCRQFCLNARNLFLGRLVLYLVRELFTFFKLDCTSSVFEAEAMEGRGIQVSK